MASSSPLAPTAWASEGAGGLGGAGSGAEPALSALERRLLDEFQRDFPLLARPFAAIAERLGSSEEAVLAAFRTLSERGLVSRIGAVLAPNRIGASMLAALAVPERRLEEVARTVSAYREVNHNYEREHTYNLWFVITAPDAGRLREVVAEIAGRTGLEVLELPLTRPYHIDLGFALWS